MAMMPRLFVRLAVAALMAVALAACGRSESYRYKLTLAVNTPDGVKRGSSVVGVLFRDVSIPERGTMHKLRGQALYLDLGPGARPMIALLTSRLHPRNSPVVVIGGEAPRWTTDAGPGTRLMCRIYGLAPSDDYMDDVPRIAHLRGAHRITPNDLPDLVTFADINDPKTVIEVDPNNLQATLSADVSWNEITLESTDEPITTGIKAKLPWLPAYYGLTLDGDRYHNKNTLANSLGTGAFDQAGDLERAK
jgi:hypothetical protein